ncbi:MAG: hypothetical protein H6706_10820 [Myxococcales bacterium]|nr:hypothetical protein [Myxococcales bacterium]
MKVAALDPRAVRQSGAPAVTTLSHKRMAAVVGGGPRPDIYDFIGKGGGATIYDVYGR